MQENSFLSGKILSSLIHFSVPLMLALLLQALYGGVDLAVVGLFGDTGELAAVSTGSQVMQSITVLISGLTMGVTVLLGQVIGAGDYRKGSNIVCGEIKLFFWVAFVITVFMLIFAEKAALLMNVPIEALDKTVLYIRICSAGIIFITAYNGISGIFRAMGNSKAPFVFVLIACAVNVALDLVFVGLLGLGASGAAVATVIAQCGSVLFSLFYIKCKPLPFRIEKRNFAGSGYKREIIKVGLPIALQDFLVNISFLIITSIINKIGLVASASIGIAEKLFVFLSIVPVSFMSALAAFVAQNVGAGNYHRAKKAFWITEGISVPVGVIMFLATFLKGDFLASLFTSDAMVIDSTQTYLKGCSFEYLLIAVSFCMVGFFNGMGKTRFVMLQGLFSAFFVRIPLSYIFSIIPGGGMFSISLAVPVSATVSLIFCAIYYIILISKLKKQGLDLK